MYRVKIDFSYIWKPILSGEDDEYYFPNKITPSMRKTYKHPAIYRWNIFKNRPDDEKLIYVGEAQELCPQRINGYLNPGSDQETNKRIKEHLKNYLEKGFKIGLEILEFDNIKFETFVFTNSDLYDKHVRRFVEELMVIIYKQRGFQILNL